MIPSNTVWSFRTRNFTVTLELDPIYGYDYDGDDEDGETQAKLNSGEYVAFDSRVVVYRNDGPFIAADYLGASVYDAGNISDFWTAHRDPDPAYRNTLANKERNVAICHYFPDMVRQAIYAARKAYNPEPRLRNVA